MTAIASMADPRIDPGGKAFALAVAAAIHGVVVLALLGTSSPPRALDAALLTFEMVSLVANETEAQPVPPPIPAAPPEPVPPPEPEPVTEDAIPPEETTPPPPAVASMPKPLRKPAPPTQPARQVRPTAPAASAVADAPPPTQVSPTTALAQAPVAEAYAPPSAEAAYLSNPKPPYPTLARQRGMQGLVVLSVEVGANGLPVSVSVKQSSGHRILDAAARKAVALWRFVPATRGSRAVAALLDVPIRFSLTNES